MLDPAHGTCDVHELIGLSIDQLHLVERMLEQAAAQATRTVGVTMPGARLASLLDGARQKVVAIQDEILAIDNPEATDPPLSS